MLDRVTVRIKRPCDSRRQLPSAAFNQAMISLADTDEMRPLLCQANAEGKALAIDVYENRAGCPILVHFSKESLE